MTGGKGEVKQKNEEQLKCVSVWGAGDGQKDTDSRWDCAGLEPGPSQWCWMRVEMAVNRRHARLSVKLETSRAQLTTKSLIVRTWVSFPPWRNERAAVRVNCRLRPTSPAAIINNHVWLNKTSTETPRAPPGPAGAKTRTAGISAELLLRLPLKLKVPKSRSVPGKKMFPGLSRPSPARCYHSLPGGFGASGRAKHAPALMWQVFLFEVFCLDG